MGILFQHYFSQQFKYISASLYLAVISSYFSHHSSDLASPIRMVIWKEILNCFFFTPVGSNATQGGNICTSGEYAEVVTKLPKYPHCFLYHTEHLCAMSVVPFVMLFPLGQENV